MWKVLFPAKSHQKRGGGQLKLRDYFGHCLEHPRLDPFLSFTDAGSYEEAGFWAGVPSERVLSQPDVSAFDFFFISGRNWKYVPRDLGGKPVVNLMQSINECDEGAPEHRYLKRPAVRICVSDAVLEASTGHRNGSALVIPNGIPLDMFRCGEQRRAGSVLIWGRKSPALGVSLRDALAERRVAAELLTTYLPREDWARRLGEVEAFVGLPREREGFYMPALEAMACGAVVVCADAVGNRAFCVPHKTCLAPPQGDLATHVDAVERVLADPSLRDRLRKAALSRAQAFSIESERQSFYRLLGERVLPLLQ